jgi:hypothetical protein
VTKMILSLLTALALAAPAGAQTIQAGNLAHLYDVDSATLTYCTVAGAGGSVFGGPIDSLVRIKTVGASTTVTEFTAATNPFTPIAVGDTLLIPDITGVFQPRVVVAKASNASITVSSAITLTGTAGHPWRYLKSACGTAATSGWVGVEGFSRVSMTVQYEQGDLTALVARWECRPRALGAQPVIVYPGETSDCGLGGTLAVDRCSFATAGITSRLTLVVDGNTFAACRVGVAFSGVDASDAGANLEQVTVAISQVK